MKSHFQISKSILVSMTAQQTLPKLNDLIKEAFAQESTVWKGLGEDPSALSRQC